MLHTAALWTFAAGVAATLALALLRGSAAALSGAIGVAFVAGLFTSGMWALRLILRKSPHLAQAGAFAVFFLQMYVGLWLAAAGRSAAWIDPSALAAGAIGATLVWQAGMVTGFATARRLVYSHDDGGLHDQASSAAEGGGR